MCLREDLDQKSSPRSNWAVWEYTRKSCARVVPRPLGDVPVGAYDSTRLSNIGIGHGAIDAGVGYTYLNPQTGHEFSGVLGQPWHHDGLLRVCSLRGAISLILLRKLVAARAASEDWIRNQHQPILEKVILHQRCALAGTRINLASSGFDLEPPTRQWRASAAAAHQRHISSTVSRKRGGLTSLKLSPAGSAYWQRQRPRV